MRTFLSRRRALRIQRGCGPIRFALLRRRAERAGWRQDEDGWWHRPVQRHDPSAAAFSHSCHAFIEGSEGGEFIYCRNVVQALRLDAGELV